MGKLSNKELVAPLLGSGLGVVASRFGSNALSDSMTKEDRAAAVNPKDVSLWRKAPFYDVVGGVVLGAVGYMGWLKNDMASKTSLAAGSFLLANGVMDMIGDLTAEEGERQYNGRPLRYVGVAPNRVAVGAQARRMAYVPSMSRQMAQVPAARRGTAALF
ncbi:MAG: hypothetical protein Q7R52_02795 [archaeon]|nr:hypothetical protein [archaeon]